ncbi:MAG: MBL fold metallo-hydrolase [Bacillota bacterium]
MRIKWFGHSCFFLVTGAGIKVMTDPYDEDTGFRVPPVAPDVVTVSHQHHDHNAVSLVQGKPIVVDKTGTHLAKGINIRGVATFHDNEKGKRRGLNTVFTIETDGVKICHLGDLGHCLEPDKLMEIGLADVLLIPVGGTYTIDANEAAALTKEMKPRIAVPMHYKIPGLNVSVAPADGFLKHFGTVERRPFLELTPDNLPAESTIVLLDRLQS